MTGLQLRAARTRAGASVLRRDVAGDRHVPTRAQRDSTVEVTTGGAGGDGARVALPLALTVILALVLALAIALGAVPVGRGRSADPHYKSQGQRAGGDGVQNFLHEIPP